MSQTGRPIGNPTKRTDANRATILLALEDGVTRKGAAAVAHMHYETLRSWIADDPDFAVACTRAEAAAEAAYVKLIKDAAPKDWRAAAWMLERRMTEHYGRRERVDMSIDISKVVKDMAEELGLDEAQVLAEADAILGEARR